MNFITDISYNVEENSWNQMLLSNPISTAFQNSDFFIPYQMAYNSKPVFISISNSSGKIVGQLSAIIHLTDYWLDLNIISRFFTSKLNLGSTLKWFSGPIIHDIKNSDEILSCILTAIDKIAIENNVNLISGTFPPQQSKLPVDIFKKNNYIIKPWITYITNINRSVDEIYNSLHNKTRYDIRKGEKSGLEFEVVSTRDSFDNYFDIKYNGKKNIEKIKKLNKIFVDHVWNISYKNNLEKMFIARFKGEPVAAIIAEFYNGNVIQNGVATSTNSNNYAGTFLTWNVIRWSTENNYKTFDVGGANPTPISQKEKGIDLFKSKWASEKIDYFLCTKVFSKTKLNISNIIKQPKSIKYKINNFFSRS